MGEVYRARDSKLGRDVAIKILPDLFAKDVERVSRFEREAKALAALNHPNVAAAYGVEDVDSSTALVMELVEGPTLADRIAGGPIPVEEALLIARQIAEALAAAHEQGIVHRDVKPDNVKVRPDGTVKVLDFGLAKVIERVASVSPGWEASTISTPAITQPGFALGTPAYMSPEQVQGRPIDRQTDIWAFGVTVFEMVTGRRPFLGQTRAETFASVQKSDPEWNTVDPRVRRLLRWCLQKDRRRRLHDIRDGIALLDETDSPPVIMRTNSRVAWTVAAAAVGVALLATTWNVLRPGSGARANRVAYVDLALPAGGALVTAAPMPALAVSSDGMRVAFVAEADGVSSIWLRSLDAPLARRLEGTDGTGSVFWAPDGRNLGFYGSGVLRRIDVETGVIRDIASVPVFRGASWSTRGTIVYGRLPGGLLEVHADGGPSVPVTEVSAAEQFHHYPYFLPDGERLLYATETGVWIGSTANAPNQSDRVRVLDWPTEAAYVPAPDGGGALLFTRGRTLYAQRFDAEFARVTGSPVAVTDVVGTGNLQRSASFSASATGVLVTPPLEENPEYRLARISPSGDRLGEIGNVRAYVSLSPSRDGTRTVALATEANFADLGIIDLDRGSWTQAATNGIFPYFVWSPDGREIVYTSLRDRPAVYRARATGGERAELFGGDAQERYMWDWTSVGLVYSRRRSDSQVDLELLQLAATTTRTLVSDGFFNYGAQVSPDGRWIAFVSNASGRDQVYVQPFPDANGQREPVSLDGGSMPVWNADGSRIYYQSPGASLMAVDVVDSGTTLKLGRPIALFDLATRVSNYPGARTWAYRLNHGEFLVIRPATFTIPSLRLTLGWNELLAAGKGR